MVFRKKFSAELKARHANLRIFPETAKEVRAIYQRNQRNQGESELSEES